MRLIKMIKILDYSKLKEGIFAREELNINVEDTVKDIISNVSNNGDKALYFYAEKFDKCLLKNLVVTEQEFEKAFLLVEDEFIEILKRASENIKAFHSKQVRQGFEIKNDDCRK